MPDTNTRETAELDTSFLENSYYHQWELVMFCFSEWHDNTMVMFSVWITMGLFFFQILKSNEKQNDS